MITKNESGLWGVQAKDGTPFDVFCIMCQIAGYLNKTSPTPPTKKEIASVPKEWLADVADLIRSW